MANGWTAEWMKYGSDDNDNHEVLLPQRYQYYTVGNLNHAYSGLTYFYKLREAVVKNTEAEYDSAPKEHG